MTVITTSTASTATAYSSQRKIDRCQNGVVWSMFWDGTSTTTASMDFYYSTDNGATWAKGGEFGFAGTGATYVPNGSFFIDPDDYAHVVYKDRHDGYIYYRRGTPNAGRTAWTWSAATVVVSSSIYDYPDVVAHREGTGWRAQVVLSVVGSGFTEAKHYPVTVTSGGAISVGTGVTLGSVSNGGTPPHSFPSIDFNHTGDGKTVAGGTPHLYVAWSAGATGSGKGIRFKKATYSGGTWTWGTEREIDSTRYASSGAPWLNCLFDGSRVVIAGQLLDGASQYDIIICERDAADTTTTSRIAEDGVTSASGTALSFGSMSYDSAGNLYLLGIQTTTPAQLAYRKFTRSAGTLGAAVAADTSGINTGGTYISAKRGYSGNRIEFVYTDGTASPYSVTYGAISLALGATIGVTTETDTAQPVGRQKTKTGGPATETDAALPVGRVKQVALGTAVETDTAEPITQRPQTIVLLGTATETDTAEPITQRPQTIVAVGTAAEADTARPLAGTLVPVYYRFTPPTAIEKIRTDRLFSRYGVPVGQTVIKIDGVYTVTPYPWLGDLQGLRDGVDYFLGGRDYTVPSSVAADLTAAGYELQRVS